MSYYFREQNLQFTPSELARYNGINGAPAYIAVDGVVYDVSNIPAWRGANQLGITAGKDVTAEFDNYNMNNVGILNTLPRVGVLVTPALQMATDNYSSQVETPGQSTDLRNLRKAAARQITGAVYHYFKASRETLNEPFTNGMTYQQYFAHEAEDEMKHYLDEIRLISRLDPQQRAQFIDHGLQPYMVEDRYPPIEFWYGPFTYPSSERESRWLKTIEHVIESIEFELNTIQFYENMLAETTVPAVRAKIEEIKIHEKGDLADFNQMLLKLLEIKKQP